MRWEREDTQILAEASDEAAVWGYIRLHQVSSSDVDSGDFYGNEGSQTVTKLEIPCTTHWVRGQKRLRISGQYLSLEDGDVLIQDIAHDYRGAINVGDVFDVFDVEQASTNEMIVEEFYPANPNETSFIILGRRHK